MNDSLASWLLEAATRRGGYGYGGYGYGGDGYGGGYGGYGYCGGSGYGWGEEEEAA